MKKKILILLMSVMVLTGCSKDSLSKQVSEEISQLGEDVTLDDEDTIIELENTYENMTDKQKNQVKNYADLREAEKKISELKKIQNLAKEAENDFKYNIAVDACNALKYALKADNIQVSDAGIYEDGYMTFLKLSFSCNAESGFLMKTMIFSYMNYDCNGFYEESDEAYDRLNTYFTSDVETLNTDVIMYLLE